MRLTASVLAGAAALALLAAMPAPSQALPKLCADAYGGHKVFAKRVTCAKARRIVRRWAHDYKRSGEAAQTVLGFRCWGKEDPYAGLVVVCNRGDRKHVSFYADVPRHPPCVAAGRVG